MSRNIFLAASAIMLTLILVSDPAAAHFPVCDCKKIDETRIRCKGGLSEGSSARGMKLDVIAHDETILVSGAFGPDSMFTFKTPAGAFYVLCDAGPGHAVEIESSDIR